jgi:hypothetical protein
MPVIPVTGEVEIGGLLGKIMKQFFFNSRDKFEKIT